MRWVDVMSDHTWRRTCRLALVQPHSRCLKSGTISCSLAELWLLPRKWEGCISRSQTLRCTLQSSSLTVLPNSAFNCMLSTVEAAFYWSVMSFPLVNLLTTCHLWLQLTGVLCVAAGVSSVVTAQRFLLRLVSYRYGNVLALCHLCGSWPYKDVCTVCVWRGRTRRLLSRKS